MKQNVYDNKIFSDEYDKMRNEKKGLSANDVIEIPIIRRMMPDVKNKRILDLGCGYGENCLFFKEQGASYVLGTDISSHMIDIANSENKIDGVDFKILPMEDINTLNENFDIVISSLAFHYIENFDELIKNIYQVLNDDGVLVFSQEHPIAACLHFVEGMDYNHTIIGDKRYTLVADYNRCGLRENPWNNIKVKKYYRNFTTVINTLIKNGFVIDEINECEPDEEMINKNPKYVNQYDSPYFLFVKVHK